MIDPGTETFSYDWQVTKDGSAYASGNGATLDFTPDDDGTYEATLTVTDDDGGVGTDSATIVVNNVNPQITDMSLNSATIDENGYVVISGLLSDAGALDAHTMAIDWGDGTMSAATINETTGAFTATHQYLDDDPTATSSDEYTISVTVVDNDGGIDIASTTVTVNNVPPVISSISLDSVTVEENGSVTVSGTINDIGTLDTQTMTIDWGDGTSSGAAINLAAGTFTAAHDYHEDGLAANETKGLTITALLLDDDGGAGTDSVVVTIIGVNDRPVVSDVLVNAAEDGLPVIGHFAVSDIDATDTHTFRITRSPSEGTVINNRDGTFTFDPGAGFQDLAEGETRSVTFSYIATDDSGTLTDTSSAATVTVIVTGTNDRPAATDDANSIVEDASVVSGDLLQNDTDADTTDTLSIASIEGLVNGANGVDGSFGTLYWNVDGGYAYFLDNALPDVQQLQVGDTILETFMYTTTDGAGGSDSAELRITISGANDAPTASDDVFMVAEDSVLTVAPAGVLTNDDDAEGDAITATLIGGPANGTLVFDADGSFTYTPDANFHGTDNFTYTADDGRDDSSVATVTIHVTPVNGAPVAHDDTYSFAKDTPFTAVQGVTVNDVDEDGDLLTAALVSGPSNGTILFNLNGTFTYTPIANFSGSDSFTYRANDGQADSNVATVTLLASGRNDAPVAQDDAYSVNEDDELFVTINGVLLNDTDTEGDPLSATLVSAPSHGVLSFDPDGSFTYTPNANFHGTDSFTYQTRDNLDQSNVATVTITVLGVNDVPAAQNDNYSMDEDTTLTVAASGVLNNDSDADADPLTAVLVGGPRRGVVSLNADGSFTYTPRANFTGTDSFTYKASDGSSDSEVAKVVISVNAVNDAPVVVDDWYSLNENDVLAVNGPGVLANDFDPDAGSLTVHLVSAPTHGQLTLNGDGSFVYTPNHDFHGVDTFTYQAKDGADQSELATVTLSVNSENDLPQAQDDSYSVSEDHTLAVGGIGVLSNDSDADGDGLTATLISGPRHGTVTFHADGTFTYVPQANFDGTDDFTYQASDGLTVSNIATVTVHVLPVNDAPVASGDQFSSSANETLSVPSPGILANDGDADGDALNAVLLTGPAHGTIDLNADGSFSYTPTADFVGSDSFTYQVSDGLLQSNPTTVSLTILPAGVSNEVPVAADDHFSVDEDSTLAVPAAGLLANDSDGDGDTLIAELVSGPSHGVLTFNPDGSFTYTPAPDFHGSDSFAYQASDGIDQSRVATVYLTVEPVNDAPRSAKDAFVMDEDGTLEVAVNGVLFNDIDPDGDPLTATLVAGPAHGALTFNPDGTFTYEPDDNFNGMDSFTYLANDGAENSTLTTVTIAVISVNDAPVVVDHTYDVNEDGSINMSLSGLLSGATDIEGDPLTPVVISEPLHGRMEVNPDGSFRYLPDADFNGLDTFTYQANDGVTQSNPATVTVTVHAVNDAPLATANNYNVIQDGTLNVANTGVLADDFDVDGDSLAAVLITGPSSGTLTFRADGSFVYIPAAGYFGTDSFSYLASDGSLDSSVVTVTINVFEYAATPPDPPPPPDTGGTDPPVIPPDFNAPPPTDVPEPVVEQTEPVLQFHDSPEQSQIGRNALAIGESEYDEIEFLAHATTDWTLEPRRSNAEQGTPDAVEQFDLVSDNSLLWDKLDELSERVRNDGLTRVLLVGGALILSTIGSVAYTLWTVWGGHLMSSILSLMPGWKLLDPLPVLDQKDKEQEHTDGESLESLIEQH